MTRMDRVEHALVTIGFFLVGVVASLMVIVAMLPILILTNPKGFLQTITRVGEHAVETLWS